MIAYKFNHFGALTELQDEVRMRRQKHKTTAYNYYQDLQRSKVSVLLIFAVQLSLTVMYIVALNQKVELLSDTLVRYWLFGTLIHSLVVADASSAGASFFREIPFWILLTQHCSKNAKSGMWFKREGSTVYHRMDRCEIFLRFTCSLIINSFCRTFIIVTLPLQLSQSVNEMDFVLNVSIDMSII